MATTGLLSFKIGDLYYTLHFQDQGWLSADMVQYLDDVLEAPDREAAILKLLGLTMRVGSQKPPRRADHWVVADLEEKVVETNSDLLRMAVNRQPPPEDSLYSGLAMRRTYEVLDRYDFTVRFFR